MRVDSDLSGGDAVSAIITVRYDDHGRIAAIVNDQTVDQVYRYAKTYTYCD